MVNANSNAHIKESTTTATKVPLAAAAVDELVKFIDITKTNPAAMAAWNEHLENGWLVIDIVDTNNPAGSMGRFILAPNLSRFIDSKMAA